LVLVTAEFRRSFRGFAGVSFVRAYAETVRGQIRATLTLSSREPHMASTDVSLKSRPARSQSAPTCERVK
jgi:hypothetical protein